MLQIGALYVFVNDRGTAERYLEVTSHGGGYYQCKYYDGNGDLVRESKFRENGSFCKNLRRIPMEEFYLVWCPEGHHNPRELYEDIEDAKKACEYLIDQKGVKEAFIMKKIGRASVPSRVKFEISGE